MNSNKLIPTLFSLAIPAAVLTAGALLTAGGPSCPACAPITCDFVNPVIEVSGSAVPAAVVDAVLIVEDGTSSCELSVDPGDLSPTEAWDTNVDYVPQLCGTDPAGAILWIDLGTGAGLEKFGECQ